MEVTENVCNIKCELGACKNRATHAVGFERVGTRGRLYMCEKCMHELYGAIGAVIVPKSVETGKKRVKGGGK